MSDLDRKLRALGLIGGSARGASGTRLETPLPASPEPAPAGDPFPLGALGARELTTPAGRVALFERSVPDGSSWGRARVAPTALPAPLVAYAREPALADADPRRVVFVDTETSGLAGGSGTLAFLVGVGRFGRQGFTVRQFALHGPWEERAQLEAVALALSGAQAVVSYNGKSFDVPLLATRFAFHGLPNPLARTPHLDLLHLARRLHGARLPGCTLGEVERGVLGAERGLEDVPGALVPERWQAFLRSGDPEPLRAVRTHNERDIVALAALLTTSADLVAGRADPPHPADALGRARLLARLRFDDEAGAAADALLTRGDLDAALERSAARLAAELAKRADRHAEAASLWRRAAELDDAGAMVELAMHLEHRARDPEAALAWVERALERPQRRREREALEHRRARLLGKLAR